MARYIIEMTSDLALLLKNAGQVKIIETLQEDGLAELDTGPVPIKPSTSVPTTRRIRGRVSQRMRVRTPSSRVHHTRHHRRQVRVAHASRGSNLRTRSCDPPSEIVGHTIFTRAAHHLCFAIYQKR